MINLTEFTGDWNVAREKLKQKFGILTDRDVTFKEGKQDEMFSKLEIILGWSKADLYKVIAEN